MKYLVLLGLVFALNLLPAFGPPTWSLLVYARLRWHLEPVALVALGVLGAASGRALLALGARRLRGRISARYRANLEALRQRLVSHRRQAFTLAGLFLVSPLPSAQLFCAAGLVEVRLAPLVLAFALGRTVSYSLYVTTAVIVDAQLGSVLDHMWGSPWWIALEVAMLVGLVVVPIFPWGRRSTPPAPPG